MKPINITEGDTDVVLDELAALLSQLYISLITQINIKKVFQHNLLNLRFAELPSPKPPCPSEFQHPTEVDT